MTTKLCIESCAAIGWNACVNNMLLRQVSCPWCQFSKYKSRQSLQQDMICNWGVISIWKVAFPFIGINRIHKSQNAPVQYPTMLHSHCAFLFWIEHCGIWNRCILGFVKLVYSHYKERTVSWLSYLYNGNPIHGKTVFILKRPPDFPFLVIVYDYAR